MEDTTSFSYGATYCFHFLRFYSWNDRTEFFYFRLFQWITEYNGWIYPCVPWDATPWNISEYISVVIPFADVSISEYYQTQESKIFAMGRSVHIPTSLWVHSEYDDICSFIT